MHLKRITKKNTITSSQKRQQTQLVKTTPRPFHMRRQENENLCPKHSLKVGASLSTHMSLITERTQYMCLVGIYVLLVLETF